MRPPLRHLGRIYDFAHLAPSTRRVAWVAKAGEAIEYRVLVRWSHHCYSRGVHATSPDDVVVPDRALRVFCPTRHADSFEAVQMIERLMVRPTLPVGLTSERNWSVYRLYAEARNGERYCLFFRLRPLDMRDPKSVDLYIESAYRRGPVKTLRNAPFGRAIELMLG